jgi:hypothetical protein
LKRPFLQADIIYPVTRGEGQLQIRASTKVADTHTNRSLAPARLGVAVFRHLIQISVVFKAGATTQLVYINHFNDSVIFMSGLTDGYPEKAGWPRQLQ